MFLLNSEEAEIIEYLENIQQESWFWAIKHTFKEKYEGKSTWFGNMGQISS